MRGVWAGSGTLARKGYSGLGELLWSRVKRRLHSRASLWRLHPLKKRVELAAQRVELRLRRTRKLLVFRHRNHGRFGRLVFGDEHHAALHDRLQHVAHLVLGLRRRNLDGREGFSPASEKGRRRVLSCPSHAYSIADRSLEQSGTDGLDKQL